MSYKVTILGSGQVAKSLCSILHERSFPISELNIVSRSINKISYGKEFILTKNLHKFDFSDTDILFGAASKEAIQFCMLKISSNCIVIDKSEAFRETSCLAISEINSNQFHKHNIFSSPNCVVIPLAIVMHALSKLPIIHASISTYQSVSGAGEKGSKALLEETKGTFLMAKQTPHYFARQIAFNVIPQVGTFLECGNTFEEAKIEKELQKLLNISFSLSVTCVRVPVLIGHSISLHIVFDKNIKQSTIELALKSISCISLHEKERYVTALEAAHENEIFISRLVVSKNHAKMWITCDNLRKGAALNAVQIAEFLISQTS